MKKFLSKFVFVAALLIPFVLVLPFSSCTTTQTNSAILVEYQTLSGVINTVDVARGVYDTLYKSGKVSQDFDNKVAPIYLEYQRIGNLAISTAKAQEAMIAALPNTSAPVVIPANVYIPQLQAIINQLLALLNQV